MLRRNDCRKLIRSLISHLKLAAETTVRYGQVGSRVLREFTT
jgi:hypothetical protein